MTTDNDRLRIYEAFFHKISLAYLMLDTARISEAVKLIDDWSYAHRLGNGEYTEKEQQQIVDKFVRRMEKF